MFNHNYLLLGIVTKVNKYWDNFEKTLSHHLEFEVNTRVLKTFS